MSQQRSYKSRCIVLRKTKLGEKDLIVTLLAENGALIRAVAKGARKPGGSFAAKLDLYSGIDAMLAKGKSLDVITEARFSQDVERPSFGLEQSACAAPVAELVSITAQEDLEHPRLFALVQKALLTIAAAEPGTALAICAAALLKVLATQGFRPSFAQCVNCGASLEEIPGDGPLPLSVSEGGLVCPDCPRPSDATLEDRATLQWSNALLFSTFEEVAAFDPPPDTTFAVLHLTRQWIQSHATRTLKSLTYLFTSTLF